jgi:hypothetical protein
MAESSVVSTDYGRKVGLGAPVFGMGWDGMGEAIGGRQAGRQA